MKAEHVNVGVLASGRGSNFEMLLRQQELGYFSRAHIVCLVSNNPSAGAFTIAREAGLPAITLRPKEFSSAEEYEAAIIDVMDQHNVDWLVLAGYMKIVGKTLLARYPQRIINIHPSLLPAFPGLHAQRQALEYGAKVSGCTVHFVDEGVDTGPIIDQRVVGIDPDATEESLSARILMQEHQLLPQCLKFLTELPWHIEGRRVILG